MSLSESKTTVVSEMRSTVFHPLSLLPAAHLDKAVNSENINLEGQTLTMNSGMFRT